MFIQFYLKTSHPAAAEAARLLQAWQAEHNRYYLKHPTHTPMGMAGHAPIPNGGRWMSCNGNYAAIQLCGDLVVTIFSRRHGLPLGVREFLRAVWPEGPIYGGLHNLSRGEIEVAIYDTQEPTWAPWATRDVIPTEEAKK